MKRFAWVATSVLLVMTGMPLSPVAAGATLAPCPIFPNTNIWHRPVNTLPLHPRSSLYVRSIGATQHLHPDFGSGLIDGRPFGIPITTVTSTPPAVRISFYYASESDRGPYRIPANALVEGGPTSTGDRHVLVFDRAACMAYELYDAHRRADGSWRAGSGAVYNLRSNRLRPAGWTSADAAGLPMTVGLVRYEEVARGRIYHAIRMTVPRTDRYYVWPARHYAAPSRNIALPPMGMRFRLKASVNISTLPYQARVIAQALKTYGAIVADNGSSWFIGGTQDRRWINTQLDTLKRFHGSDFEAVNERGLQIYPDSAAARAP